MTIYDDYYEVYRTTNMVEYYLNLYLDYCKDEGFDPPEAETIDDLRLNPGLVGHVVYHAKIQERKEA